MHPDVVTINKQVNAVPVLARIVLHHVFILSCRLVLYKLTFCICRLAVITLDLLSVLSLDDNSTLTSLDWLRAQSVCRQIPHEW